MKPHFVYEGVLPASKSILNRLKILQSFSSQIRVLGDSQAKDVLSMTSALKALLSGQSADCQDAGTVLRFLALRASRIPGTHHLTGSRQLFARPQQELIKILNTLGCRTQLTDHTLTILSAGWKLPKTTLKISMNQSSQFASAVLLSAWNLSEPFTLKLQGNKVSEGYLHMTLKLVQKAGMNLQVNGSEITLFPSTLKSSTLFRAEIDLSSAASLAAIAVAQQGVAIFHHFPKKSLQPDAIFIQWLKQMGCQIDQTQTTCQVNAFERFPLKPLQADFTSSPDLFPVLSILCTLSSGISELKGISHLIYKESNRLENILELLEKMNIRYHYPQEGVLKIFGQSQPSLNVLPFSFQPRSDHRLAMAAMVAKGAGYPLHLEDPWVVEKSFPEFWKLLAQSERKFR